MRMPVFLLRTCKIFLVSVAKLGDDPVVGAFLQVVYDLVCLLEKFRTLRLILCGHPEPFEFGVDFNLRSLVEKAGPLRDILLDPSRQWKLNNPTPLQIAHMLASVMDNLVLFHILPWSHNVATLEERMKALGEQMQFLENFRLFATSSAADSDPAHQNLLAHIETVSIKVAFILLKCVDENLNDESFSEELLSDISKLIRCIKPIDPQVHQVYTDILKASKSRRRSVAPADPDVDIEEYNHAKGFLDCLRSYLLDVLQLDTHGVVSGLKGPLQELYQGLESLKVFLSHQPTTSDLTTKDHVFDLVCDAGILICSLNQAHIQLDHDLQDLLEAIRLVLAESGEKPTPEPMFKKVPCTAPLSFVDFLLERLSELTSSEVEANTRSHAHAIKEQLVTLRSFLGNIVELGEEQEEFQTLRDHMLELVYRAEHLIDCLVVGDLSDAFSLSFDSFIKDIKSIHMQFDVKRLEIKLKELTVNRQHVPSQTTLSFENEVVGYLEEAESIKHRLTRGSKNLQIVAILGMPGQGKTTLATKVYNHHFVSAYFSVCVRTVVSQTVDKRRVLLDLLGQLAPEKCSDITSDQDLVQKVWQSLKGRRYLIFLDDVWDVEALSGLKEAFPEDHTASRILLTSRHHVVDTSEEPFELRPFNEEESMDLLQRKLFNGSGWPIELVDIGREIAHICKGLPLTILIVAGILSTMEREDWKKILGGLGSGTVSNIERCRNTLELSYNHLPEHLRPCLLYLATLPEDEEVLVRRLKQLWIAEGFVRRNDKKRVEDVAEDLLKDLINRSLVMVAKERSIGGSKSCRVHDLLHEFCLQKAKYDQFLCFPGGKDEVLEFHESHYLRRLCINIDPKHLIRFSRFFHYARSLNFNYSKQQVLPNLSSMFRLCKLLRVLDLEQINLGSVFPSEIGLLVQLAFLAIQGTMIDIPPSIGNLSSLECFILNQIRKDKTLALPGSVWKLKKLRHLQMNGLGGVFAMENLHNSSDLCELDWLSGVAIRYPFDMEGLLKKFPNLHKLRCNLFGFPDMQNDHVRIVVPDFLGQLESLSMLLSCDDVPHIEFSFPTNLKKLTLSKFPLSSSSLSTISKLSNLEVLKLKAVKFERDIWEMEEETFSKLRFLQLQSWTLSSWSASDDQFECLEKLVLMGCGCLKEMPSCLENSSTLAVIEVRYCSSNVYELVRKIKEVQEYNGYSELKINSVKFS